MKLKHFTVVLIAITFWLDSCDTSTGGDGEQIPATTKVLLLSNDASGMAWFDTTAVKYISGLEISSINIRDSIPTAADLKQYDVVLFSENGLLSLSDSIGSVLHDFVMAGGNLLMSTFVWQDRSDNIGNGGDPWITNLGKLEDIDPLMGGSCRYANEDLGTINDHALTKGVDSLNTYYRGGPTTLRSGATAVAWWADGDIFIGYNKPNGRITGVTTWVYEPGWNNVMPQPGFMQLWSNALFYTAWGSVPEALVTLPSKANLDSDDDRINTQPTGIAGSGSSR